MRLDARAASVFRLVGVQAALVAAAVHLLEGVPRLLVYLPLLSFRDPRPYLFVPSALALVGLGALVARGVRHRRVYSLSAGLLLAYAAGYVWWHLGDHGGLVPAHEPTDPVGEVAAHLAADPLALVAFAAELLGAACFLVLFAADPAVLGPSDDGA